MNRLFLFVILFFSLTSLKSQISTNFLPSNVNPLELRPSDIPSEQILQQMGFSESQISEALDFKYSRGKYAQTQQDTSSENTIIKNNVSQFYENFGDTIIKDTTTFPTAKIYGQDIFRNNKLEFYNKALDAKAPENYKVGPGDEISISVWGYSQFSENLQVDSRGYINPSSYGRIYVKGLTFKKMRSVLKNRFSTFLDMKNSEIDVTLSYSRVITVNIVGEVYNPGSYTISAINTAFNALIAANGPTQIGTVRNIYIKRDGKIVDSLDVYHFLFKPMRARDIYLQDGDYIFVPPASNVVRIKGEINRPYTYEVKNGENVLDAIKYAGGFTTNAFSDLITMKRLDYNSIKVYDIHKDHLKETKIRNGDELIVNPIQNKLSNVVSVQTDIGVSGDYEYIKGERILDLLYRSKCIDDKTFLERAYVIRLNQDRTRSHITLNLDKILKDPSHEQNILLQEYDVIRVLSIDDFDDIFSVIVHGAVRKSGIYDYGISMTLQDILLKAGGITQEAEGSRVEISRIMNYNASTKKLKPQRTIVKTIPIGDELILSLEAQEFKLEPFDQIFVRSNPDFEPAQNIVLSGEVKYPGVYTLSRKDEKISSLISRSGGFTDYAFLEGVKMYRKFEVLNDDLADINISDQLMDSLFDNPGQARIYFNELNNENQQIFREKETEYQYNMVYLDLEKALRKRDSKHNIVLTEGDSIVIPKIMDLVHITGDLTNLEGNSISAPHFNRRRAHYYVNNFAGGYSKKNNNKKNTVVVYPNGIAKKTLNFGLFSVSPKVKKGSTIMVAGKTKKEKKKKGQPIDWNRQIENAMLKVTAVLTLWLLVERVNGSAQ